MHLEKKMRTCQTFIFLCALALASLTPLLASADEHDHHEAPEKEIHNGHTHTPGQRVHADISGGYAYARNGFIVPPPLRGGLEDGHGAWFHIGLHPASAEWFEANCGGDIFNKDDGNYSWGIHCGVVFAATIADRLRLGIGPLMGYHGERRMVTLSGQKLTKPETGSAFIFGLSPTISVRLFKQVWLGLDVEAVVAPPGFHKYWEWEVALKPGLTFSFN